jgi:hypothetical protein
METIVYEIEFNDGRVFRVFCANSTQKKKVIQSYYKIADEIKEIKVITTGLHTADKFLKTL